MLHQHNASAAALMAASPCAAPLQFQLVMKMVFISHLLGCGWFYVTLHPAEGDTTWVIEYDGGSAAEGPVGKQYLMSLYWALTTLTTVGYGDITPTSDIERQYATIALLVGAMVFAYLIGEIGGLIATFDRQAVLVEEKMDGVKEYLQWRGIPRDVTIRVKRCEPAEAADGAARAPCCLVSHHPALCVSLACHGIAC